MLIVNRGFLTPALLSRQLGCPVTGFMTAIAARPLGVAAVTGTVLWVCRATWLPGNSLRQIIEAGAVSAVVSFALAGRYCVLEDHRRRILELLQRKAPLLVAPAGRWLGETAPSEI